MDQILDHCEGVIGIADDISIHGKDDAEHDRRLHKFMKVAENMDWYWTKRSVKLRTTLSSSLAVFMTSMEPTQIHQRSVPSRRCLPPTEQRRASELPWNGNISVTIPPTTIFSHSNTQRTSEDQYRILLEHYISSCIWQAQIIGMWGHNAEELQHKETSDNPSQCIQQGTRSHTHPGWWSSRLHIQSTHTHRAVLCKQWEGTTHLHLWCRMFPDICFW